MKLLGQLRIPISAPTVLVVAGIAVCLLTAPLAAEAQQVGKAPRPSPADMAKGAGGTVSSMPYRLFRNCPSRSSANWRARSTRWTQSRAWASVTRVS